MYFDQDVAKRSRARGLRILAGRCVVMMAALFIVGAVSHGVLRHLVQTSPLWIAITLGLRQSSLTKWAALPRFVFWLLWLAAIWLYLRVWARIAAGTFTPTEIAMTVGVGVASTVGIARAIAIKSEVQASAAVATTFVVAALRVAAARIRPLREIAHRYVRLNK
jgi:hypothetical protein